MSELNELLVALAEMLDHYADGLEVGIPPHAIVAQMRKDAANLREKAGIATAKATYAP